MAKRTKRQAASKKLKPTLIKLKPKDAAIVFYKDSFELILPTGDVDVTNGNKSVGNATIAAGAVAMLLSDPVRFELLKQEFRNRVNTLTDEAEDKARKGQLN